VNTKVPTITGTAQQGQTLTEVHGTWENSPTGFTYKWQQCNSSGGECTVIAGATAQTYVPVAGDVGHTIRVEETANNEGGSTSATSAPTAVVKVAAPVNTKLPTISGIAQQGQTLTEVHGTWENSPTGFTYKWQQCNSSGTECTMIAGATAQTYVPVAGDVGHTIRVEETASNEGGSASATSAPTLVVKVAAPKNTKAPEIIGTAQQGQMLTEVHGTWENSPTGFTYKWQQCNSSGTECTMIAGATAQTYVPVAGDVGHTIRVEETANNEGGSTSATSAPTAVVKVAAPVNTKLPTISGTAQQGQTLTEVHGTWENSPTGFTYKWQQCNTSGTACTVIAGATAQTYVPVAGDVGHTIRVEETASNEGGSASATSAPTAVVKPAPPVNETLPTITGTALQNQTLTEHNGTWANNPTSFAIQWQRCDTKGANCSPISGATAQTYTLASGDVGSTIRVAVTATNSGGSSAPASSAQTAVVAVPATFGKTSVGATSEKLAADTKWVSRYALSGGGSVVKLSVYLAATGTSGQQLLKGIIYSDTGTAPGALLGVTEQLTFKNTSSTGWYDLPLPSALKLAAGNYWIGVISGATAGVASYRYDTVAGSRDLNANIYTSGPSEPFGTPTTDGQQVSLYATYSEDPVLAAVGDISCPAGDTKNSCQQLATANLTAGQHPKAVAVLGDNQYESGLLSEFNSAGAYNETWGQFNSIVHPAPGNHEYAASSSASGYFSYFGSSAGNGNYSYELGAWHVISLNSDCTDSGCQDALGGTTSTAEVNWLQSDLAAHPKQCILAYWHHPRFSSGFVGNSPGVGAFWTSLYASHADVVVNGHDHMYERFAQQDPSQNATTEGIREFVSGTGGESLFTMGTTQPNMQFSDNKHFGVLLLTLHATSYDWSFRSTSGTVLDSGSTSCHNTAGAASVMQAAAAPQPSAEGASSPTVTTATTTQTATAEVSTPFSFDAVPQQVSLSEAAAGGIPVIISCSRACDVTITITRSGEEAPLASYRETENQIREPRSRVVLRLPSGTSLGDGSLSLTFSAVDAAFEQRTVTRSLVLTQG
jgi:fibronectin type 3 domain-containing protein